MKEKSNIFISTQESSSEILLDILNNGQNGSSESSKSKVTAKFGNQESEANSIHSREESSEIEAKDQKEKEAKEETEEESKKRTDVDERSIKVSDLNNSFISEISEIVHSIDQFDKLSSLSCEKSQKDKMPVKNSNDLIPLVSGMSSKHKKRRGGRRK